MSDNSIKQRLQELEDKVENKIGIDLPSIAWIVIAVISADIVFDVASTFIKWLF